MDLEEDLAWLWVPAIRHAVEELASTAVRKSNAAYRQHATPADAGLPDSVSLSLLDPWDGAAIAALTDGLQVDV